MRKRRSILKRRGSPHRLRRLRRAPLPPIAKESHISAETHTPRTPANHKPAPAPPAARPHFSRPAAHSRDRKPAQSSSSSQPDRLTNKPAAWQPDSTARPSASRPSASRTRPPHSRRDASVLGRPAAHKNGSRAENGSRPGQLESQIHKKWQRFQIERESRRNGTGKWIRQWKPFEWKPCERQPDERKPLQWKLRSPRERASAKSSSASWTKRAKTTAKPASSSRSTSAARGASSSRGAGALRKETRVDARPARNSRKPALTAGAKAGNSKRYGFTARPKAKSKPKQETKKRA